MKTKLFFPKIAVLGLAIVALNSCGTANSNSALATQQIRPSKEYDRFNGSWTVTYCERYGSALPERNGAVFYFKGDHHWISGDRGYEFYAIDERTSPKSIDFYDHKTPTIHGIYKIEGNQLILCTADPGLPRPTEFKTSRFSGTIVTKTQRR